MVICFIWKKQSSKALKETIEKKIIVYSNVHMLAMKQTNIKKIYKITELQGDHMFALIDQLQKRTWNDKVLRCSNACSERNDST